MKWAILSGIEGNLTAYEAVLKDIRRQSVSDLYILGDVIGLEGENEAVIQRLQSPRPGELVPQVCVGWWEEQCFSLHGVSGLQNAPELMEKYGGDGVKTLWESVSRESVRWLRSQHFGFHELDCLLIHGSTVSYADELTPDTPAIQLCDRLIRADANYLFCGRSGLTFECWVTPVELRSTVTTLDGVQDPQGYGKTPRQVVGVGSVGRIPGKSTYTLFSPENGQLSFRTVNYGKTKGFGATKR
ncbi:metallo-dependent phosphatase [Leptolyngbya sp. Heron Island J]|uniref:metallophosphoesterase family protein n=1 Tax=Leptolyngbya sp. Heron Island J TaxID=1385935 RepID=UPI0003B98F5A|nr:metallo-dependent phosphatase [Leptolyngbya sp. Heron Island J]ESA37714.1 metallo-dependent phosphatase [Leptolyngbya sp. Heron Island J]